ncbi:MAG: PVC-type heme-binding CxxCH protein [Planctomycetota bacterium]|nr:PVC-type heme-binding CxxCH protein [Planctomycetota bacterium]
MSDLRIGARLFLLWAMPWFLIQSTVAQEDLSEFVLHPDCRLELVACEPNIVDPVAMRFDEKGRIWVVEMRDYPMLEQGLPTSRIKILEDRNSDGFFETSRLFADQLLFPTGLQPWKNGVIVTLEGKVVYLADNDGDFVCDQEEVLFTGFAAKNTQLRANHPTLGPDGKVYVANGLRNGEVTGPRAKKSLSLTGKDFRFDPLTLRFQAVTGYGQFGLTFDESGHRYTCTNRNPLRRVVFDAEYLEAAGKVLVKNSVTDVAASGAASRLFPIGETWTTSNLHANQFTAACGVHIHCGTALPGRFSGNAFTCDPTAHVVHREVISLEQDPVVGHARPGREGKEFLASRNPFFRPVNLSGGPDGSLYVVDMRRRVIEHPQFMPPELKRRPDLRTGSDLGRIYRVAGKDARLDHQNRKMIPEKELFGVDGWRRSESHRLLKQSGNQIDFEVLRSGLTRPDSHPNGLIRALSLLQDQEKLRPIDLDFAVSHYSTAVRSCGIRLCESEQPGRVRQLVMDENDQVRFQALLSLSRTGTSLSLEELKTVALNSAQNEWVQTALLMVAQSKAASLLESLVEEIRGRSGRLRHHDSVLGFSQKLAPLAAANSLEVTVSVLEKCLDSVDLPERGLRGLAVAILRSPPLHSTRARISRDRSERAERWRNSLRQSLSGDAPGPVDIELLARISQHEDSIVRLATGQEGPLPQKAALQALQLSNRSETWQELARSFRSHSFEVRREILLAAVSRPGVARELLEQVKNGRMSQLELGADGRKKLVGHPDSEVRKLAQSTLRQQVPPDRKRAFQQFVPALELKTDARRGKPLFEKKCAACHQLGELGNQIGPDISDTRTKSKSQLLLDIIRPNAAIDNHFVEYLIETTDGTTVQGILLENNATGITVKQADNRTVPILRDSIERIQSSGKSLMPVGLEEGLSLQQMADLVSFLQNWRYLEQNVPFLENENAK